MNLLAYYKQYKLDGLTVVEWDAMIELLGKKLELWGSGSVDE